MTNWYDDWTTRRKIASSDMQGIVDALYPLFWRGYESGAFIDEDGYIVLAAEKDRAYAVIQVSTLKTITYGTYTWKAKVTTVDSERTEFVGFGEYAPSNGEDGIFVKLDGVTYKFECVSGGVSTSETLAGQDWTIERTFKVAWAAGQADLYVDDVLVKSITTNVPSVRLVRFAEIFTGATYTGNRTTIHVKDFGERGV